MSRGVLWFWMIALALSLTVIATAAWRFLHGGGGLDPSKMAQPVQTVVVKARAWDVTYTAQGLIEAENRVDLNAETPGTVVRIAFTEGQAVAKGQPLIYLRADKQAAQSAEAMAGAQAAQTAIVSRQADVRAAQANLDAVRAASVLASSELQRYEALRRQEFISDLELEQKRAAAQSQQARLHAAEGELARAQAQVIETQSIQQQARARLGYNQALSSETVIRAPFGGVVGQKYVDLGDTVMTAEKLVTVVDNRRMKIAFEVPERYLPWLRPDQPVRVRLGEASAPQADVSARVIFVAPTVNPQTHTVALKALIHTDAASPQDTLRDGQFAKALLTLYTEPQAVVIPEQAAVPQGEKFFVYVAQGDRVAFRAITPGERQPGWVAVNAGLKAGEEIVVDGVGKLFDGARIRRTAQRTAGAPR